MPLSVYTAALIKCSLLSLWHLLYNPFESQFLKLLTVAEVLGAEKKQLSERVVNECFSLKQGASVFTESTHSSPDKSQNQDRVPLHTDIAN